MRRGGRRRAPPGSRGASAVVAATRTRPRVTPGVAVDAGPRARASSASTASAWASSSSPAGVSSRRAASAAAAPRPSSASSRRTCCESADWVTHSASAARVKLAVARDGDEVLELAQLHAAAGYSQPCQSCVKVALAFARPCATSSPPPVTASSSSTAAWARRSSSSTCPSSATTSCPGRCHEALVLNRPDVIQGVHESMVEAGAEVVETDTFQASRLKLDEWGLGEHTLEINRRAAEIARKAVGEDRFVAGSIGPTGFLPASEDPTLGQIRFRELVEVFAEQAQGLLEGGVDLLIIETAQDILEVKAAIFGVREAFKLAGRTRADPGLASRCCPTAARCCSAPTSAPRWPRSRRSRSTSSASTARPAPRTCATRSASSASTRRVPVHCIPNAGIPHQGPNGETIFPEQPGPLADALGEFVERYGVGIVGGCCGTTPEHIRAINERCGDAPDRRAPRAARRRTSRSMIAAAPLVQEPAPDDRRRARELAGLAQGQGAAARRRLRRPAAGRRGPGRGRRPRARPLRRADRAPGRGRADAARGQEGLAHPARADPGRLDRARGDRDRARPDPRPRDRQLGQPRGRPRTSSTASSRSRWRTAPR